MLEQHPPTMYYKLQSYALTTPPRKLFSRKWVMLFYIFFYFSSPLWLFFMLSTILVCNCAHVRNTPYICTKSSLRSSERLRRIVCLLPQNYVARGAKYGVQCQWLQNSTIFYYFYLLYFYSFCTILFTLFLPIYTNFDAISLTFYTWPCNAHGLYCN